MYCVNCNRITDNEICPVCGKETTLEIPHVVYWCDSCRTPIIHSRANSEVQCPLCKENARYLGADLRPVFPEERLLLETIVGTPLKFIDDSVWAIGSKYYINGKPHQITTKQITSANPDAVRRDLQQYSEDNTPDRFEKDIARFIEANTSHKQAIVVEACDFIKSASKEYPEENLVISFSGAKIRRLLPIS